VSLVAKKTTSEKREEHQMGGGEILPEIQEGIAGNDRNLNPPFRGVDWNSESNRTFLKLQENKPTSDDAAINAMLGQPIIGNTFIDFLPGVAHEIHRAAVRT
jgi:hypothetical protein